MFFTFRVNIALLALGIPPDGIRAQFRQTMEWAGQRAGNSPQEVAIWIASQLPLATRPDINPGPLKRWVRARRIDPQSSEMREALGNLGLQA
jgi:hypothetical protein